MIIVVKPFIDPLCPVNECVTSWKKNVLIRKDVLHHIMKVITDNLVLICSAGRHVFFFFNVPLICCLSLLTCCFLRESAVSKEMNIARQCRVDCRASSRDVISVAVNHFFPKNYRPWNEAEHKNYHLVSDKSMTCCQGILLLRHFT